MIAPLARLADAVRRAHAERGVRVAVHVPPRSGTTRTLSGCIAALLWGDATSTVLVGASVYPAAVRLGAQAARSAASSGLSTLQIERHEWRTREGGVLFATGAGGASTPRRFGLAVIDTPVAPIPGPSHAHAAAWITGTVDERADSTVVVCSRCAPDDALGRLEREGYELVTIPAVGPDGAALAPILASIEHLTIIRGEIGEGRWRALYQGEVGP